MSDNTRKPRSDISKAMPNLAERNNFPTGSFSGSSYAAECCWPWEWRISFISAAKKTDFSESVPITSLCRRGIISRILMPFLSLSEFC